jgi:hypothetical protein
MGSAADPVPISEKAFMGWLVDLAHLLGWEVYHPWLSVNSPRGWPDLALCRPPRLILAELKREDGKATFAQQHWLDLLGACPGVETYLWRPSDRDAIESLLQRRRLDRDELLAALLKLNKQLRRNGVSPMFGKASASTLSDDQLELAVVQTRKELVATSRALAEELR